MPIISTAERKTLKVRLLLTAMYLLLVTGAVAMVYPFLLMLGGSTKSAVDFQDSRIIPAFTTKDNALYAKYLESLFNESALLLRSTYNLPSASFTNCTPPAVINKKLIDLWQEFTAQDEALRADVSGIALATTEARSSSAESGVANSAFIPRTKSPGSSAKTDKASDDNFAFTIGFMSAPVSRGTTPANLRAFADHLQKKISPDIGIVNQRLGTDFPSWSSFIVQPENYLTRRYSSSGTGFSAELKAFKSTRDPAERIYFSVEGFYRNDFLKNQYSQNIAEYNRKNSRSHTDWNQIPLPQAIGQSKLSASEKADWSLFVRQILNLNWIRIDTAATPLFHDFLKAKYNTIEAFNHIYSSKYNSFEEIFLPPQAPQSGIELSDWESFLQGWKDPNGGKMYVLPAEAVIIVSTETRFRDLLKQRFPDLEKLNAALNTSFTDWNQIYPPQAEVHYLAFQQNRSGLRKEFLVRNYLSVFDYLVLHGRGILNTFIYCSLAILCALIFNPLAAYALSRYRPASTYKFLLFLMLTMSFPPMVTQIPVFLMLREFNLLNTFLALILPGLANGYSIFLLKGFFDSLPRELYESAEIDGAGEFRIFWSITMSLSKPILAVISLNAFTAAYSNFMMALLICQDERMWTLMPWLYQLQLRSSPGIVYASLVIAAIPTMIVFMFCQKIIIRGIVVPVEK